MPIKGGCLCGKVRFDCRKTSATGHASHMIVPEPAFSVSGEVRFYDRAADSGNMVSRGFCPNCGSAIYSTNAGMPGVVFVRASSLDDTSDFKPMMIVYTDRAAEWDVMDSSLPR
jgi:hypothetical protein